MRPMESGKAKNSELGFISRKYQGVFDFFNSRGKRGKDLIRWELCSEFDKSIGQLVTLKISMTWDPLELQGDTGSELISTLMLPHLKAVAWSAAAAKHSRRKQPRSTSQRHHRLLPQNGWVERAEQLPERLDHRVAPSPHMVSRLEDHFAVFWP